MQRRPRACVLRLGTRGFPYLRRVGAGADAPGSLAVLACIWLQGGLIPGGRVLRYYTSRDPEPTLYVQDKNRWQSFPSGGQTEVFLGTIPDETMLSLNEIDPEEGEKFIKEWVADGQRAAAEEAAEEVERTSGDADRALELREQFVFGTGHATSRQLEASPELIQAAAAAWAGCSGWFPVTTADGLPAYRWGRFVPLSGNIQMKVVCQPRRGNLTEARFVLGARGSGYNRLRHQMWIDACEYFADRVARELTYELAQMPPDEMEAWERKRDRRQTTERVRRVTEVALPAAALPVGIVVGVLAGNALWGMAIGFWLVVLWLLDTQLRMRAIGMRVVAGFVVLGVLFIPIAAAVTAIAARGGG
jgi:hypothetical protein